MTSEGDMGTRQCIRLYLYSNIYSAQLEALQNIHLYLL